jgi:GYF domain 2
LHLVLRLLAAMNVGCRGWEQICCFQQNVTYASRGRERYRRLTFLRIHSTLNGMRHVAGQTYGPYSGHEIRRMVQHRQIVETDFLCREGASAWVQAKNDPIIGAVFADRHEIGTVASSALNFGRSTSSARSSSGPIGLKLTLVTHAPG